MQKFEYHQQPSDYPLFQQMQNWFSDLNSQTIDDLIQNSNFETYHNQIILRQNEIVNYLYAVIKGQVEISRNNQIIMILKNGLFGEECLQKSNISQFNVKAINKCKILVININKIQKENLKLNKLILYNHQNKIDNIPIQQKIIKQKKKDNSYQIIIKEDQDQKELNEFLKLRAEYKDVQKSQSIQLNQQVKKASNDIKEYKQKSIHQNINRINQQIDLRQNNIKIQNTKHISLFKDLSENDIFNFRKQDKKKQNINSFIDQRKDDIEQSREKIKEIINISQKYKESFDKPIKPKDKLKKITQNVNSQDQAKQVIKLRMLGIINKNQKYENDALKTKLLENSRDMKRLVQQLDSEWEICIQERKNNNDYYLL